MRAIVNNCEDEQFTDEEISYQVDIKITDARSTFEL